MRFKGHVQYGRSVVQGWTPAKSIVSNEVRTQQQHEEYVVPAATAATAAIAAAGDIPASATVGATAAVAAAAAAAATMTATERGAEC